MQDNRQFGNQLRLSNAFSAAMVQQLYPAIVEFEGISDFEAGQLLSKEFAFGVGHQATVDVVNFLFPGLGLPEVNPQQRVSNRLGNNDQILIHQLVDHVLPLGAKISFHELLQLHHTGHAKFVLATAHKSEPAKLGNVRPRALVSAFSAQTLPAAEGAVRFTRLTDAEAHAVLPQDFENRVFETSRLAAQTQLGRTLPPPTAERTLSLKPGESVVVFQRLGNRLQECQVLTEQAVLAEAKAGDIPFLLAEVL